VIVALGKLALTVDTAAGRNAEPLLFDQALTMFQAPDGSALELRGALVVLGLSAAELRAQTVQDARATGYEPATLAAVLYARLLAAGADPLSAPRALLSALAAKREAAAPAPVAEPAPGPEVVNGPRPMADPYPGLRRGEETWPAFLARRGHLVPDEMSAWNAARVALAAGTIKAWVETTGAALGFTWEPAEGG
jgi:hypothetical protein